MQQVSSDLIKAVDPKQGDKKSGGAADEVAKKQFARYVRARDYGHTQYLKRAEKCDRFYQGDQWEEADRKKLEEDGRPALTINMILATVNTVLGEQASTRADVKFKNRRGGSEAVANVLNKLWLVDSDRNRLEWVESQIFADGVIRERGWYDVRIDFDDNLQGEVTITADDPTNILLGVDGKEYDPRTWTEIFETKWLSLDELEALYGKDKREALEALVDTGGQFHHDSIRFERGDTFGDAEGAEGTSAQTGDEDRGDIRAVRVIERQHYKLAPCHYFVDPETGDSRQAPGNWDAARREAFADRMGLLILKRTDRKVRWTITADQVVLHDEWSPYRTFTKIPYFPYFRRGRPFGVVTNLISPQEQLNKVESQMLHIVNTTANSGWMMEAGSLVNMTADDLRKQGAQTGLVLEFAPNKQPPEKIKPNTIPTGLDRVAAKAANNVRVISGVNEGMLGMDSAEVSGIALEKKEARGLVQIQVPLDHLALTRHLLAEKCLELWQQFYTEHRVFRITHDIDPSKPPEEYEINGVDETGAPINDITLGKYDVSIGTQPARDTFNESQFAEALSLRNAGVMIPDDRIIEYSHLARKQELAQELRDLSGRGEMTEAQAQQLEFQEMIARQMAQLEVRKLNAEVAELEASAMVKRAEAEQTAGGLDSPEYQMERERMEKEIQEKREELQLRMRLAELSAINKLDISAVSARNKLATKILDNQKNTINHSQ